MPLHPPLSSSPCLQQSPLTRLATATFMEENVDYLDSFDEVTDDEHSGRM